MNLSSKQNVVLVTEVGWWGSKNSFKLTGAILGEHVHKVLEGDADKVDEQDSDKVKLNFTWSKISVIMFKAT